MDFFFKFVFNMLHYVLDTIHSMHFNFLEQENIHLI